MQSFFYLSHHWIEHPDLKSGRSKVRILSRSLDTGGLYFIMQSFFYSYHHWIEHPDLKSGRSKVRILSRSLDTGGLYFNYAILFLFLPSLDRASRPQVGTVKGSNPFAIT